VLEGKKKAYGTPKKNQEREHGKNCQEYYAAALRGELWKKLNPRPGGTGREFTWEDYGVTKQD